MRPVHARSEPGALPRGCRASRGPTAPARATGTPAHGWRPISLSATGCGVQDPAQAILIWAPPVLAAVILHEIAHGWVANRLGDDTARASRAADAQPAPAHRSVRHHHPAAAARRRRIAVRVRLGEAGAGQLPQAAQPQARHGQGRRWPARRPTSSWRVRRRHALRTLVLAAGHTVLARCCAGGAWSACRSTSCWRCST